MSTILKTFLTWVITFLTGSIFWGLLFLMYGDFSIEAAKIILIIASISGVFSIPGIIIYHQLVLYLNKYYPKRSLNKIILAGSALLITLLSALIASVAMSGKGYAGLLGFAFYGIPFAVCAFFFNYEKNVTSIKEDERTLPDEKTVKKYFLIISGLEAILFLQSLPNALHNFSFLSTYAVYNIIFTVAVPIGVFLLWRNNKIGWAILVFKAIFRVAGITSIIKSGLFSEGFTLLRQWHYFSWLIIILIDTLVLILLNKNDLCRYLGIFKKFRLLTVALSLMCYAVFSLAF